jgi:hypothetical protein
MTRSALERTEARTLIGAPRSFETPVLGSSGRGRRRRLLTPNAIAFKGMRGIHRNMHKINTLGHVLAVASGSNLTLDALV